MVRTNGTYVRTRIPMALSLYSSTMVPKWYTCTNITLYQKRLEIQVVEYQASMVVSIWQYDFRTNWYCHIAIRTSVPLTGCLKIAILWWSIRKATVEKTKVFKPRWAIPVPCAINPRACKGQQHTQHLPHLRDGRAPIADS